jgi:hypothetical protein
VTRLEGLPEGVRAQVVELLSDPQTLRFDGGGRIPAERVLVGDVGVLRGDLELAGRVDGGVVVVGGNLRLLPGARIQGDALVVGGRITGPAAEVVEGRAVEVEERLEVEVRDGRVVPGSPPREEDGPGFLSSRARLMVRSAGTYNRVEGLPVLFGPVLETDGPNPFRLDIMGLWRTEAGLTLDAEEMGFLFRAEQRFDTRPAVTLGASYRSRVEPISAVGLSSLESSLATFLLHKDHRDYVEREGWTGYVELDLDPRPLRLRVGYRDDNEWFAPVSSPWSIRKNDDPWRPQPLVAEGDLRALEVEAELDTRNDPEDPTHGWWITARVERGVSGDLALPDVFEEVGPEGPRGPVAGEPVDAGFTRGKLDLRRYNRVGPDSELDLRLLYSGSLDGESLPPQFQEALGGEGTLPGYRLFSLDCGARSRRFQIERVAFDDDADAVQPVFPAYGCDRALLLQLEFRRDLPLDLDLGGGPESDWGRGWTWFPRLELVPTAVAFMDAGWGWSESDPELDSEAFVDAGLGLNLGDLGIFWAYPLRPGSERFNFFVRLQRRF